MRSLTIAGRTISDTDPCYVIAEVGNNHGGRLDLAAEMVVAAADCGCDAVKFQRRDVAHLYTQALLRTPYDHEHSYGATYGTHRLALELPLAAYRDVFALGRRVGIAAFATAFDAQSADDLLALGPPALKIASGDLTNTPLLAHVATAGVPIILSTGGATWADVDRALNLVHAHTSRVALLHCTAAYPVHQHAELNLRAIPTMRDRYPEVVIGWSGHDTGIALAVMAYTLGARIIEKHFTLHRTWKGTDQAFSLEPGGMRRMVRDLGRAREAWGTGEKLRYPSEVAPLRKMEKVLVATRSLSAGQVLQKTDLTPKIAGLDGIPPYAWETLVGFPLALPLSLDEPITYTHLRSEATV